MHQPPLDDVDDGDQAAGQRQKTLLVVQLEWVRVRVLEWAQVPVPVPVVQVQALAPAPVPQSRT